MIAGHRSWSLPGHVYANVRQPIVHTLNLAHLMPLSSVWAGPARNAHLDGPPLLYAETSGSTPWSLLRTLYSDALQQTGWLARMRLRLVWWRWRIRADWLPTVLACFILAAAAGGVIRMQSEPGSQVLVGLLTVAAGVFAYMRLLFIGSAKAAAVYSDLKADAFEPIIALYGRLVKAIRQPVVVFVDDLDRCSSEYVVELVEGIQTLFRSQPVTYVVAAGMPEIDEAVLRALIE